MKLFLTYLSLWHIPFFLSILLYLILFRTFEKMATQACCSIMTIHHIIFLTPLTNSLTYPIIINRPFHKINPYIKSDFFFFFGSFRKFFGLLNLFEFEVTLRDGEGWLVQVSIITTPSSLSKFTDGDSAVLYLSNQKE